MNLLKGQKVLLYEKVDTGMDDDFGRPIFDYIPTEVDNVLISPTSDDEIFNDIQIYGKASVYTLSIPKHDEHEWEDTMVEFFGKTWDTFGPLIKYQEELVPGQWNAKIRVRRRDE